MTFYLRDLSGGPPLLRVSPLLQAFQLEVPHVSLQVWHLILNEYLLPFFNLGLQLLVLLPSLPFQVKLQNYHPKLGVSLRGLLVSIHKRIKYGD